MKQLIIIASFMLAMNLNSQTMTIINNSNNAETLTLVRALDAIPSNAQANQTITVPANSTLGPFPPAPLSVPGVPGLSFNVMFCKAHTKQGIIYCNTESSASNFYIIEPNWESSIGNVSWDTYPDPTSPTGVSYTITYQ